MSYTEAQKRAITKYLKEKTEEVRLRVHKGTKELWRHYAERKQQSMTAYVVDAVDRMIAFDECGENEIDSKLLLNLMDWLEKHGHTSEEITDCLQSLSASGGFGA